MCIEISDENILMYRPTSSVLITSFKYCDLEVDPLVYLVEATRKDPAAFLMELPSLGARVKLRDNIWRAHLSVSNAYDNF